jgi:uncharacterized phage-like protein YoqJ
MLFEQTVVAFTGHRPDELGGYADNNPLKLAIQAAINAKLIALKPITCITGMALGVDQWAAEVCMELGIPFIAAVPFVGQEVIWPKASQEHFHAILKKAAKIHVVCKGGYTPEKMQTRNEWMVDHSTDLIAVYNGCGTGGTHNCVEYAKKVDRRIHLINPALLTPTPQEG